MKKNLLLIAGLCLTYGANAQIGNHRFSNLDVATKKIAPFGDYHSFNTKGEQSGFNAKAAGDTVFYDNFDTADNWTIDNQGKTGTNIGWALVSTSRTWAGQLGIQNKITSSSGGKFMEVMNGKYVQSMAGTDGPIGVQYTITSKKIDITGKNYTLSFQQYGALFNDAQEVYISTDSTTWTKIYDNYSNKEVYDGGNPGNIYTNPDNVSINLGTIGDQYISAAATSLYIRFYWSKRSQLSESAITYLTFGWMIDDVLLSENSAKDVKIDRPFVFSDGEVGGYYTIIPKKQVQTVVAANPVLNNGYDDLTGVKSYMKITKPNSTVNDTVSIGDLSSYMADTTSYSIDLTGEDEGTYLFSDFGVLADEDEVTTNNNSNFSFSFDYGGYLYALDKGKSNVTSGELDVDNDYFETGNLFEIYEDDDLTGIDIYFYSSGSLKGTEGTVVFANVYTLDDAASSQENPLGLQMYASSEGRFYTSFNNRWSTLVFVNELNQPTPVHLEKGELYFVTIGTYGSGNANGYDLCIGLSGVTQGITSLSKHGEDWGLVGGTPMVRMNFTPGLVSTENLAESVKANIYPNPANDKAVVEYNTAFDGDVTVSVVDMSGRTVYSNTVANQNAGNNKVELNVADFNAGVYQVVIAANSTVVTKKLVVK